MGPYLHLFKCFRLSHMLYIFFMLLSFLPLEWLNILFFTLLPCKLYSFLLFFLKVIMAVTILSWIYQSLWQPTPVLSPGKSHGQRSLVGCSPWGCEESDTTERLHFHFSLSCIGEGNGDPLQCSCLENPRGSGAWWAAVFGVAQSQTQLK